MPVPPTCQMFQPLLSIDAHPTLLYVVCSLHHASVCASNLISALRGPAPSKNGVASVVSAADITEL